MCIFSAFVHSLAVKLTFALSSFISGGFQAKQDGKRAKGGIPGVDSLNCLQFTVLPYFEYS